VKLSRTSARAFDEARWPIGVAAPALLQMRERRPARLR
jgi:hypothetical protein